MPSSPALAREVVRSIDWDGVRVAVEYGPGLGAITGEILTRTVGKDFFAIELNEAYADRFRRKLPRVPLYRDSVANLDGDCRRARRRGHRLRRQRPSLGNLLGRGPGRAPRRDVRGACAKGGQFATFAYMHGLALLPGADSAKARPSIPQGRPKPGRLAQHAARRRLPLRALAPSKHGGTSKRARRSCYVEANGARLLLVFVCASAFPAALAGEEDRPRVYVHVDPSIEEYDRGKVRELVDSMTDSERADLETSQYSKRDQPFGRGYSRDSPRPPHRGEPLGATQYFGYTQTHFQSRYVLTFRVSAGQLGFETDTALAGAFVTWKRVAGVVAKDIETWAQENEEALDGEP